MNQVRKASLGNKNAIQHGVYAAKRTIKKRGKRGIDKRTRAGKDAVRWEAAIIQDLGGADNVSTMKMAVIDAGKLKRHLLQVGIAYLFSHPEKIINSRKRSFSPIVLQLTSLAESFEKSMVIVGLERKSREIDLAKALAGAGA